MRECGDGAETARSLPHLGRSALGQPMLRRPTTGCSERNRAHGMGDELMDMLGNYLDLKPIASHDESQGGNPVLSGGSANFYKQHFPLLLRKKKFTETEVQSDNKVVSQRQIVGRQTSEQKRRAELSRRCRALDRALTSLERGADDMEEGDHLDEGVFVTELREDTFDPRSWPWNVERYQI